MIVSYKSAGLVKRLLDSLAAERAPEASRNVSFRAVVIDNASGDTEPIERTVTESGYKDWVTVIPAPRNGGFAYGNNLGFRHGMESPDVPDYFFLLNPDTEVRSGAITPLVRFLDRHPAAGIVASSLESKDGSPWPFAFRYPSLLSELDLGLHLGLVSKLLHNHIVVRAMGSVPEQVDWFPGAAMMVRRKIVEDLGGMDENYFLYFEETDFCLKVTRAGWTNWYLPESRVMHIAGETTGVTGRTEGRRRLPDYWFESRRRYFAKNHGLAYAVATDVVRLISHMAGKAKDRLKLEGVSGVPHFARDLVRHAFLRKANWSHSPAQEWKPNQESAFPPK